MKIKFLYPLLLASITVFTFFSCTTHKTTANNTFPPTQTQEDGYISIPIYYGTNRNMISDNKDNLFGGKWTNEIKYGYYKASIPDGHKLGELEQAGIIQKIKGQSYDPTKYFNILENQNLTKEQFLTLLAKSMENENKDQAFIFIHGYNNSFESSALRTAQLFYDLKYKGIPIMYSWPSTGKAIGYFKDGNNIEKSSALFQTFIQDIAENNPDKKLNLIAHSMGNRLLVETINNLQKTHPNIKFENIIMAAPDVGRNDFRNNYDDQIIESAHKINLYCSKKDKALNLSKFLNFQRRLGLVDSKTYVNKPLQTIDVTNAGKCKDMLSHTCFAQSEQIINDIKALLNGDEVIREEKNSIFYIKYN